MATAAGPHRWCADQPSAHRRTGRPGTTPVARRARRPGHAESCSPDDALRPSRPARACGENARGCTRGPVGDPCGDRCLPRGRRCGAGPDPGPDRARTQAGQSMSTNLRNLIRSVLVAVLVAAAGWGIATLIDPRVDTADIAAMREAAARTAGSEFLDKYAESDGRVVRRDEGGDVVSEGQSYGMLIAAALGYQKRFRSIWGWTKDHLLRPDGLLSWRWADDQVIDSNSAADADLDAARALVLAGSRFNAPELTEDGKRLGEVILQQESVTIGTRVAPAGDVVPVGSGLAGAGQVLVAGNWATTPPYLVNAGYFSPRADEQLARVSADRRWLDLSRSQRVLS